MHARKHVAAESQRAANAGPVEKMSETHSIRAISRGTVTESSVLPPQYSADLRGSRVESSLRPLAIGPGETPEPSIEELESIVEVGHSAVL